MLATKNRIIGLLPKIHALQVRNSSFFSLNMLIQKLFAPFYFLKKVHNSNTTCLSLLPDNCLHVLLLLCSRLIFIF